MTVEHVEIRSADAELRALPQVSRHVATPRRARRAGRHATPLNLEALDRMGFDVPTPLSTTWWSLFGWRSQGDLGR